MINPSGAPGGFRVGLWPTHVQPHPNPDLFVHAQITTLVSVECFSFSFIFSWFLQLGVLVFDGNYFVCWAFKKPQNSCWCCLHLVSEILEVYLGSIFNMLISIWVTALNLFCRLTWKCFLYIIYVTQSPTWHFIRFILCICGKKRKNGRDDKYSEPSHIENCHAILIISFLSRSSMIHHLYKMVFTFICIWGIFCVTFSF